MFRRCRKAVYEHTCTTRVYILDSGCPANCVSVLQPRAARDPTADGAFYGRSRGAAMGHGEPEMGQSRTTRRIDSYDFACCFITTRELRPLPWSLMCGETYIGDKSLFLFLPSFFHPLSRIRDTFILFRARGNRRPRCFSRTMEQYLVQRKWKYI